MASETAPASLAEALSRLQENLPHIKKAARSHHGQYADLATISAALMPELGKLGLSFTCLPTLTDDGAFVLAYALQFKDGSDVGGRYPLPPMSQGPQALGSAITYARRYALCAVTGAVADEDDDGNAAQAAQQPAKRTRGKPPERAPGNLPRNADGSLSRSQITDDELAAAGVMTSGDQKAHTALRNGAVTGKPDRPAERLTAPDPDDPWAAAPPPGPAIRTPNAAQGIVGVIVQQFDRLGITDRDERLTYTSRLAGRELSSSKDMTKDEAAQVADALSRCRDIGQLQAAKEMADHA